MSKGRHVASLVSCRRLGSRTGENGGQIGGQILVGRLGGRYRAGQYRVWGGYMGGHVARLGARLRLGGHAGERCKRGGGPGDGATRRTSEKLSYSPEMQVLVSQAHSYLIHRSNFCVLARSFPHASLPGGAPKPQHKYPYSPQYTPPLFFVS